MVIITKVQTGRCEDVTVSGSVSGTVFSGVGGCGQTTAAGLGRSRILGPSLVDGAVSFSLGTGGSAVGGYDPFYVVSLFDDLNDDTDDVVLSVQVLPPECGLLTGWPADTVLRDGVVQSALADLWLQSNPYARLEERREMGAYVVTKDGLTTIVPFKSNSAPDMCSATIDGAEIEAIEAAGGKVEALGHTHPFRSGSRVPTDRTCLGNADYNARFGDGPSEKDLLVAESSPWPSYVVDYNHVHALDPFHDPGKGAAKYDRNRSCTGG